jgi:uncharacterized membrane protein YfcA
MTVLLGFAIAVLVGLTGVGAGSVTAPALILFFGQSPSVAVGTALVFTVAIKVAVAPVYLRRRQVEMRALGALCAGGVPGVLAGVVVLAFLDVRRYEGAILLLVGLMVAGMAAFNCLMLLRTSRPPGKERRKWLPWIGVVIGAEVGFSSAGAGALGSLALMNCTSLTPAQVVGTDLWFGLALSAVGGSWRVAAGGLDFALLGKLVAGGVAGVYVGAALATVLRPRPLRLVLSVALFVLGVQLCVRGLR